MVSGQLPVSQEWTHHSSVAASVRDLHLLKSPATGGTMPFAASFAAFSADFCAASSGSSVTTCMLSSEHSHIVGQLALLSLHVDVHHSSLALSERLLQASSSPTITSGTSPPRSSVRSRAAKLAESTGVPGAGDALRAAASAPHLHMSSGHWPVGHIVWHQ